MKVLASVNAFYQMSGGDKRFAHVFRHLEGTLSITVASTQRGLQALFKESYHPKSTIVIQSLMPWVPLGIGIDYIIRAISGVLQCLSSDQYYDIYYSSSDSLPDIVPGFFSKRFKICRYWIAPIFHLIPSPRNRPGNQFRNALSYLQQRFSLALLKHSSDVILVLNPFVKHQLQEMGFRPGSIHIVSGGIDYNAIKAVKAPAQAYEGISLGRIHPAKGSLELLEIWKRVCERRPDAKLVIIGEGDQAFVQEVKDRIEHLNLSPNVELTGFLDVAQVIQTMKASKLFVAPSREEGWGIAVCEAMACGLPVVAYDLPAYHNFYGINRVPMGDMDEFAGVILRLLSDESLRRRQGQQVEHVAARYDWEKVAGRELNILEQLIS